MIFWILISVLIVSCIGAGLAALLVISEGYFRNYGDCEVTINNEKKFTVKGGGDVLSSLIEQKIFIPSACGGRSTCGLCKIKVIEGGGTVLPTEDPHLNQQEKDQGVRLSCQVKIRNNIFIEIPRELFAIREYTCRVASIKDLTHDIKEFRFELTDPDTIEYVPGQYVQLLTPIYEKSSEEVYRAYSMSSDPADKHHIETIIRLVPGGICTTYCFDYLKVDDEIKLNGPYGHFHLSKTNAPMIFIAGGSGMSPLKCLLHQMVNENIDRKCTYFFGANIVKEMFMIDLMREFESKLPNFKFVPVIARPAPDEKWDGETGLVTEAVQRAFERLNEHEAYLCGSPGMIDASIKVLNNLGISDDRIFYDKFA